MSLDDPDNPALSQLAERASPAPGPEARVVPLLEMRAVTGGFNPVELALYRYLALNVWNGRPDLNGERHLRRHFGHRRAARLKRRLLERFRQGGLLPAEPNPSPATAEEPGDEPDDPADRGRKKAG